MRSFASRYSFDDSSSAASSGPLYSDLNAEERKLAVMTQAAAMELDGQEEDGASSRVLI